MKVWHASVAGIVTILVLPSLSFSQSSRKTTVTVRPVMVTASRLEGDEALPVTRGVDRERSLSFRSSLVDARTRGPRGVQDDISMRGAPFEETLVLLDGVRMNDPQTGHFTMDIPVTRFDLEAIDVIYGPQSAYYGSSGMGGTVSLRRRRPDEKLRVRAEVEGGQYDYYRGTARLDIPLGPVGNSVSFEGARSGGYRAETEFNKVTLNYTMTMDFEKTSLDFMFGYLKKDFGADSFYSDVYENEEEHTDTRLFKLDLTYYGDEVTIRPIIHYRRHWDKFILDRNRPDWSVNFHKNYTAGGELSVSMDAPFGALVYGAEVAGEEIESTSLGDRKRDRFAFFFEDRIDLEKVTVDLGARIDNYSSFGWEVNPQAGIGYAVGETVTLRASAGRSFRAPTFTELYYRTAANVGNPDLDPESAWTFDAGMDYTGKGCTVSVTPFVRLSENMIDWTREGGSKVWQSQNIGSIDLYGLEALAAFRNPEGSPIPLLGTITVKYGYNEAFRKKGITSKYVLRYLLHNLLMRAEFVLPYDITGEFEISLKKRIGDEHYYLLNSRIYKDFLHKGMKSSFFIAADNLLDTDYTEVGQVSMPGLWITAGVGVEF